MNDAENNVDRRDRRESLRRPLIEAAILITFLLMVGWSIFWWLNAPPLKISHHGSAVTIDVQTLGEYPTSVSCVRVSEVSSGQVIWEIRSVGIAQARSFILHVGENSASTHADHGTFRVIAPLSQTFVLRSGVKYKIELWGGDQSHPSKRSAMFQLSAVV